MQYLRQSTAATVKIGPFLDDIDGNTEETGLTIAQSDVRLSKNGGDFAQKNDTSSCTHDELGMYNCPLDATDTGTLGRLKLCVHKSGALTVWHDYMVLTQNAYDALFGSDYLDVNIKQISDDTIAANNLEAALENGTAGYIASDCRKYNGKTTETSTVGDLPNVNIERINESGTASDNLALITTNAKGSDNKILISSDAQDLSGSLDVNAKKIGGTTQTGNDIGADVNSILEDTDELQTNQGNWTTATASDVAGAEVNVTQIGGDTQSAADLKDFADSGYDPSTHKIEACKVNDDMRGTDGANTVTPDNTHIVNIYDIIKPSGTGDAAAIKAKTDNLPTDPADQSILESKLDTAQADLDIITGTNGVILNGTQPYYAPNTTEPDNTNILNIYNLIKPSGSGDVAAIKAKTDNLPDDPADQSILAGKLDTAQADLDIITGTDGVILNSSQPNYAPNTVVPDPAGTAPTASEIADAVWSEDLTEHDSEAYSGAERLHDILEDTGTTIPAAINTAQNDLDKLTGADGAVLATSQPNYAPNKVAPDNDGIANIQDMVKADKVIDTSGNPWVLEYREKDSKEVLLRQTMKNTSGENVTSNDNVLGRLEKEA